MIPVKGSLPKKLSNMITSVKSLELSSVSQKIFWKILDQGGTTTKLLKDQSFADQKIQKKRIMLKSKMPHYHQSTT